MPESVDFDALSLRLTDVFQPSTPIKHEELFRGRTAQVRQVIDAINQPGRHAIIYGGRGVGKTSLAQTLPVRLKTKEPYPVLSLLIPCDSSDDYSTIWFKVFSEIEYKTERPVLNDARALTTFTVGDGETPEFDQAAVFDWSPFEVRRHLEPFGQDHLLYIIFDEFDKIADLGVRQLFADTIKLFSDRAVSATLIVIGVSDDVTGLIEDHRSIERCLAQIHMPRMPRGELEQIVLLGHKKVGMEIEPRGLDEITGLSKGLPTYTHLLALHASREALDHKTLTVTYDHVRRAIKTAISQTEESIRTEYDKATYSTRTDTLHVSVMLACAMAETDEFGRFQPIDVCGPMNVITGKNFTTDRFAAHLKQFSMKDRGAVLKRTGAEYKWRYQFVNPLLQPYILMRGLDAGLVTDDKLDLNTQGEAKYPLFKKKS